MATDLKKQIAETFVKHAQKTGMDKVTVNSIVKECNISRQAFYYYYQDIIDVARYVLKEGLQMNMEKAAEEDDPEKATKMIAKEIASHFPMISIAVNSRLRSEMERLLVDEMKVFLKMIFSAEDCGRGMSRSEKTFHADFLACGVVGYSIEHCNDPAFDTDEFADMMWDLLKKAYYK